MYILLKMIMNFFVKFSEYMKMRYPQVLLTFCKESDPNECRCAWANFNENGIFTHMTGFYGEILTINKGNKIVLNNEVWVLMDGEFKHEVRQFEKSYDNQQAEQISLMV